MGLTEDFPAVSLTFLKSERPETSPREVKFEKIENSQTWLGCRSSGTIS